MIHPDGLNILLAVKTWTSSPPQIEDTDNLIVSVINIYEVFKRILQQRDENDALQAAALMQQDRIVDVDFSICLDAAKSSYELKMPMADSLILASARSYNAILWTQDSDFENLPEVKFVQK